jgi:hypothetical protein
MAVEFTGVNGQGITFQPVTAANNLQEKTVSFLFYADAFGNIDCFVSKWYDSVNSGWYIDANTGAGTIGKIRFHQTWSGALYSAVWNMDVAPSTEAWHNLAITYNYSSDANNPVFYLDGTSVAITEGVAPSGTVVADTNTIKIGWDLSDDTTINGKLQDVRIYNRIITATEVEILAKSRCQNVVLNGLVFWAPLNGAAGLPSFEGATMGASNYVRDVISGAIGTPVGNPLGAGNTIQRIR